MPRQNGRAAAKPGRQHQQHNVSEADSQRQRADYYGLQHQHDSQNGNAINIATFAAYGSVVSKSGDSSTGLKW
jgi:hypothetical protein